MKKRFLLVSALSMSLLMACSELSPIARSSNGEDSNSSEEGIVLPENQEIAKTKLYELANTQGFEITYRYINEEDNETQTVGFKNDVLWLNEDSAMKKVDDSIEVYEYNSETYKYDYTATVTPEDGLSFDEMLDSITMAFYAGYEYSSLSGAVIPIETKEVTVSGRKATEYACTFLGVGTGANLVLVFDNDTGVTLKVDLTINDAGVTTTSTYEVISFLTGDRVVVPVLNKDENPDPQPDDDNPFNNIKLDYVSNNNANVYANSSLCLFEDGSFELSFTENKKLVAFLGSFTFSAQNNTATLITEKVYKEMTNEYTKVNETWAMAYSDNFYVLAVSSTGDVTYKLSKDAPTHLQLPDDKTGGQTNPDDQDAEYKITSESWNDLIVGGGLTTFTSNFTATVHSSDSEKGFNRYELDKGSVRSFYAEETIINESYYVYDTNGINHTCYYVDPDMGVWVTRKGYTGIGSLNNSFGILPIPFSAVMFSVTAKAYTTAKWTNNYGEEYTNIMFKFNNGYLTNLHFTDKNGIYHETSFSKYGTTTVTLPEVGSAYTPGKK